MHLPALAPLPPPPTPPTLPNRANARPRRRREYLLPDGVTSTWGRVRPVEEMWQQPKRPEPGAPPPQQETVRGVRPCLRAKCVCMLSCCWHADGAACGGFAALALHPRPHRLASPLPSQALVVNNERFMVPEALFHPSGAHTLTQCSCPLCCTVLASLAAALGCPTGHQPGCESRRLVSCCGQCCRADIGMEEAGLAETIVAAVQAVHPHLHALLYSNILLTGGCWLGVQGSQRAGGCWPGSCLAARAGCTCSA